MKWGGGGGSVVHVMDYSDALPCAQRGLEIDICYVDLLGSCSNANLKHKICVLLTWGKTTSNGEEQLSPSNDPAVKIVLRQIFASNFL